VLLYGASLMLEFVTLVVLRIREPQLRREFRVPGGITGAVIAGLLPLSLLGLALFKGEHETVLGVNGLAFGALIMVAGFAVYAATARLRRRTLRTTLVDTVEAA